jgi:transposase-like protein/ribosomal protein L37AE/L43A
MDLSSFDFPKTEVEFDKQFGSEEACRTYLYKLRQAEGWCCEKCGHDKFWHSKRDLYICEKCQHQHSLTSGTMFHRSRKPLTMWFKVIWWYTTRRSGVNATNLQELLGISYPTAWSWLQKLRMHSKRPEREKLSGQVEVDEFYLGGSKTGKQGRGSKNKTTIIAAVEKNNNKIGRIRMQKITNCEKENLKAFINENIEKGSKIITDGWSGYFGLDQNSNYDHEKVVSSVKEDVTPGVHRVASLFKRVVLGTYQGNVSPKHVQKYLDEYVFRFNRRKSSHVGTKFYKMIQLTAASSIITFNNIVHPLLEAT